MLLKLVEMLQPLRTCLSSQVICLHHWCNAASRSLVNVKQLVDYVMAFYLLIAVVKLEFMHNRLNFDEDEEINTNINNPYISLHLKRY
jgi:hypothetical protein